MTRKICITHNSYCEDGSTWQFPTEDATEIVRLNQVAVSIEKCPLCREAERKTIQFLRGKK